MLNRVLSVPKDQPLNLILVAIVLKEVEESITVHHAKEEGWDNKASNASNHINI